MVSDASETGQVLLHDIPNVERVQMQVSDELHRLSEPGSAPTMTEPEPEFDRGLLERALLGDEPHLTSETVATRPASRRGRAPAVASARLPRARGHAAFTDTDLAALALVSARCGPAPSTSTRPSG